VSWRFEHRSQPLLSRRRFLGRIARYAAVSLGVVVVVWRAIAASPACPGSTHC
jgi:hypothetical protein